MRYLIAPLLALSASVLICSCGSPAPVDNVPLGAFRYTAFDSTGVIVVKGYLTLDVIDSADVEGEWHMAAVGTPANIGPQVGTGKLVGGFVDGLLSVNLNPNMRDNNVILTGILQDQRTYDGTWSFVGYAGPMNKGAFRAWR